MPTLLHHTLDPSSRLVRLMLAEYGVGIELVETAPWRREPEFLDVNPAATVPVMFDEPFPPIVGILATIAHIEANFGPEGPVESLLPENAGEKAETWRLLEWVLIKLGNEVTGYLLEEKLIKRAMRSGSPDPAVLRIAKANLGEHLAYFSWLLATRRWLAGDTMTLADFALAAHFSTLDYMGDIDWDKAGEAKDWYARIKSRPAFRTLLADRVVGMPASRTYTDLDF
ncbi:glutathione S-transferase family protein [Pelagibacterium montanilacus]|uniref:glutathione S-transferase family protein n=1 Tax=Pelagibacterium montanilacus TaxID=2185280 RepID=UPI000F8EB11D|nr:glutathione S-transferase family protein [Pelagibacterium montanilacus]